RKIERSRSACPREGEFSSWRTWREKIAFESSARGGQAAGSKNNMKKASMKQRNGDLRPEYDVATMKGAVRGKYFQRAMAGTNLVLLEPDVARAFPDSDSVNRALRLLRDVAQKSSSRKAANGRRRTPRI